MATYPAFGIITPEQKAQNIQQIGGAISGGIKSAFAGLKGITDILNDRDNRKRLVGELIVKYPKLAPMQAELEKKKPEELAKLTYNIVTLENEDKAIKDTYKDMDVVTPDYVDLALKTLEGGDLKTTMGVYGNVRSMKDREIAGRQTGAIAGQTTREGALGQAIPAVEGQPLDDSARQAAALLPTEADFMRARTAGATAGANVDLKAESEYSNKLVAYGRAINDYTYAKNEWAKKKSAAEAAAAMASAPTATAAIKQMAKAKQKEAEEYGKTMRAKSTRVHGAAQEANRFAKKWNIKQADLSDDEIKYYILSDFTNMKDFVVDWENETINKKPITPEAIEVKRKEMQ